MALIRVQVASGAVAEDARLEVEAADIQVGHNLDWATYFTLNSLNSY
jgi:hypothetical protein